jgi:hypothetical protein
MYDHIIWFIVDIIDVLIFSHTVTREPYNLHNP